MSMNLYVGNLSSETTESELKDLFAQFGEVESAKIITDRHSGNPKGFGFVEMSSRSEGEKAITELNGKLVHNREIVVNRAQPKKPRRGFEGGGRGRF